MSVCVDVRARRFTNNFAIQKEFQLNLIRVQLQPRACRLQPLLACSDETREEVLGGGLLPGGDATDGGIELQKRPGPPADAKSALADKRATVSHCAASYVSCSQWQNFGISLLTERNCWNISEIGLRESAEIH